MNIVLGVFTQSIPFFTCLLLKDIKEGGGAKNLVRLENCHGFPYISVLEPLTTSLQLS